MTDPTASALSSTVDGQFRLEKEIGRGGMGVVYLATDVQLERPVAIKTLPPHLAADASVRHRFVREARTAAALSHPNIVPIYHAAERDGVGSFALGYVPGESLAERIAREGPIPVDELVPILLQLSDALGYAHSRGVVHRDVKAENVLIDSRTGRAMVTDFGIARVTEAQPLTATGTVLGTVHYMSPEQVLGDTLDGRSDLYALGVLAFYAATGRFPFERASAPAVLVAHVNTAPPRLHEYMPDAPDFMDEVIARLLEKRPSDRFEDAAALSAALRREAPARGASRPESNAVSPVSSNIAVARRDPRGASPAAPNPAATDANSAPELLSADDAEQVWARAAQLQANTGVLTPPPAFALRPSDADPVTRAYDAALVKASAAEAGIDLRYVERALAERENAEQAVMLHESIRPGEAMAARPPAFAGARTKLEFTADIDGELDDLGFEDVAEEIRSAIGEMVTVSAVGRTLTVTSAGGVASMGPRRRRQRMLQIHLTSRNGRTHIRAFEDLGQTSAAVFAPMMGAGGMAGGMALGGILTNVLHTPAIGIPLGVASMLVTMYGAARIAFSRVSRKREAELRELLENIARVARLHVSERPPAKLSRSV